MLTLKESIMQKLSTKKRVEFLQQYVRLWHIEWRKNHPENIIGFRIDKKVINGKKSRFYSIIFHVVKKEKHKNLKPENIIPKYFSVKFPDNKIRNIKTDIEETGMFTLHSGITSEVQSVYSNKFGSASLFVTDSSNRVFILTNYHVVAEQMIENNKLYYRRPANQDKNDVKIGNGANALSGRFEEGIMSHAVDAAFVEVFLNMNSNMNILPDQNKIKGHLSVRPIPSSFIGTQIKVYSYYNKQGRLGTISNNSSVLYTDNSDIYFEDILQISPRITQGGDSGGSVLTTSFSIIGIIVGADNNYSYAIPFYKIDDFKNIFII